MLSETFFTNTFRCPEQLGTIDIVNKKDFKSKISINKTATTKDFIYRNIYLSKKNHRARTQWTGEHSENQLAYENNVCRKIQTNTVKYQIKLIEWALLSSQKYDKRISMLHRACIL